MPPLSSTKLLIRFNYERSLFDHQRERDLADAKSSSGLEDLQNQRSQKTVGTDEYSDWKDQYTVAQEEYEAKKVDIEDYYDNLTTELEEEANRREELIQEQLDELEVRRQDMQAEFDAIKDQVKTEIQNSAISF